MTECTACGLTQHLHQLPIGALLTTLCRACTTTVLNTAKQSDATRAAVVRAHVTRTRARLAAANIVALEQAEEYLEQVRVTPEGDIEVIAVAKSTAAREAAGLPSSRTQPAPFWNTSLASRTLKRNARSLGVK